MRKKMLSDKLLGFILAFGLQGTTTGNPARDGTILDRPVALKDLNGTSAEAVEVLLAESGASGGVISVYDRCAQPRTRVFSVQGVTLRGGLDYILTLDGSRKWTYQDGVLVVGLTPPGATLLDTVLGESSVDPEVPLTLSTQKLLQSKEVAARIAKMGLVELTVPLGYSAAPKDVAAAASPRQPPLKIQSGRTLQQALDILASSKGRAIWQYEQFTCGHKSAFRITW
jgi:hypothetical protein